MNDSSEPQPDVALLARRPDFYAKNHPTPADVLLLVDVAESSLAFDREKKIPLYAASSLREVWLVDLKAGEVVVHRSPGAGGYAEIRRAASAEVIAPLAVADCRLAVAEVTGPRRIPRTRQ